MGLDNGVSGTVGIIFPSGKAKQVPVPVKKCLNYTKKKQWVKRLNSPIFADGILRPLSQKYNIVCCIERPMVNPGRWKSTLSAVRCYEATVILLEYFQIPYEVVDSKEWQKELLPKGLAKKELKTASLDVAQRLFPRASFYKMKDGDGLLIAEYARRRR